MAKKKKKKTSSKAQYDAKKKNLNTAANLHEKSEAACEATVADVVEAPDANEIQPEDLIGTVHTQETEDCPAETEKAADNTEAQVEESCSTSEPESPLPSVSEISIPYDPNFSEADFSASVNELKAEDIDMPEEKEEQVKKKKKLSRSANILQIAILVVCGSVALVCMFLLGENIWGKIKGKEIYASVQSEFEGFTLDDNATDLRDLAYMGSDSPMQTLFQRVDGGKSDAGTSNTNQYKEQLSQMKASLSALKSKHKDIYGWIYVPNTNINHPIVKCDDNNYYLNHAPTGDFLPIGSIFADLTTKELVTDNYNTVIYGHNVVASGESSMFHDVEKFLDPEFFKNTKIYIYTMDGAFLFEPIAIYDTVADDFYFKTVFSSEADFLAFAKEKISNSNIYSDAVLSSGDRMLTLSTCTNGAQDGRYALHARLVEVIQ